jgi:outer membrane biosynthesis protein TonB
MSSVPRIEFVAYEIELVSPPPTQQAEELQPAVEELVIERPEPEPEPPPPEPEPTPPEPDAEPQPATTVETPPEPEAETSGEGINVRLEGLRRDYPEYYNNIIRQIGRCFYSRWRQGGSWETVVAFTLGRGGVATDLEFLQRSGNVAFDFEAMGAVDCAGQGRFGPLPDDLPWDAVRISFTFEPPNEQD